MRKFAGWLLKLLLLTILIANTFAIGKNHIEININLK